MKTPGNPSLLKICLLMLMFVSYSDTYVFSKPRGGQVVSGTASFTQDGNLTVITAGNRSVINYMGFDIGKNETVQFVQPSAHSTVLNRVTSLDPTNIFGTLQANGIVVIANPYGVFFQNGSVVNVGGLIAGAGKVSAADFTRGKVHFTDLNGDVRNDGVIAADNRIALMGANVVNTGSMTSAHGVAMMVSGQDVYVGDKDGNVFVKANGRALQAQTAAAGGGSAGSVTNSGTVAAPRVLLGAGDMYSTAIVNSGLLQGRGIAVNAGKNGSATVGGTLDASAARNPAATGKGGRVDVLGGTVALKGATVSASGATDGGKVRIGGDFHGGGTLARAATTTVDAATTIKADAGATGNGGTVVLWSEQGTSYSGQITARGGSTSGDGGQVEVSSHAGLGYDGRVDASPTNGKAGSLLLDPTNIEISSNKNASLPIATNQVITASSLEALPGGTALTLTADQDFLIDPLTTAIADNPSGVQTVGRLTLAAPVAVVPGNPIIGAVTFTAGNNGQGSFVMDTGDTIVTNGRPITINANGLSTTDGINTGNPNAIQVGAITTSPGGDATAGGSVNLTITGPISGPVVVGTNLVTTSGLGAGGAITINGSAAANLPTSITTGTVMGGRLTSSATGTAAGATAAGGAITLASSGPINLGGAADASSSGAAGGAINIAGVGAVSTGNLLSTSAVSTAAAGGTGTVSATGTGLLTVNRVDTSSAAGPGGRITLGTTVRFPPPGGAPATDAHL